MEEVQFAPLQFDAAVDGMVVAPICWHQISHNIHVIQAGQQVERHLDSQTAEKRRELTGGLDRNDEIAAPVKQSEGRQPGGERTQPRQQVHRRCWCIEGEPARSRCLTCSVYPGWPPSGHAWVSSMGSSPLRSWLCAWWRRIPPLASVRARNGPGCCRRHSALSQNQIHTYLDGLILLLWWGTAQRSLPMTPLTDCATSLCTPASMKSSSLSSVRNSAVKAHKWAPAEWPTSTILSC